MAEPSAKMEGKFCAHHRETPAVSRCFTCFTPLCQDCIVPVKGRDFCSKECANNHFEVQLHIDDATARAVARRRKALLKKLILLLILGGAIIGGWYVWTKVLSPAQRRRLTTKGRKLGSEVKKEAGKHLKPQ